jgi:L-aminopeptidase/D-esterase-like protein
MRFDGLKRRIERLEQASGGDVTFTLSNGTTSAIRRSGILDAVIAAVRGKDSAETSILRSAVRASDGSRLHEMVQAMAAGPVPRGEFNAQ